MFLLFKKVSFFIDPLDGAQTRAFKTGREAPLRVNPEPSARAQAEGKPQPSGRGVEGLTDRVVRKTDFLTCHCIVYG
jgi:hypothetical protein